MSICPTPLVPFRCWLYEAVVQPYLLELGLPNLFQTENQMQTLTGVVLKSRTLTPNYIMIEVLNRIL